MEIRFKKGTDGSHTLTCVRDDGSVTTSKMFRGEFGPVHDLLHYAVETTLGLRQAFFGLLASGWDARTFEEKGASARMPDEAAWAEALVGLIGLSLGGTDLGGAAELNETLASGPTAQARPNYRLTLTDDDLRRICERWGELRAAWRKLESGDTLSLPFPAIADSR